MSDKKFMSYENALAVLTEYAASIGMAGKYSIVSQAEYDALTPEEKADTSIEYFIYDAPTPGGDDSNAIHWSEAKRSVKKNLLPNNATSQTINGVTFTVNSDGSVTANGTASADTWFVFNDELKLEDKTYTLTGCPIGGGVGKFDLTIRSTESDSSQWQWLMDYGDGITANGDSNRTYMAYIGVMSGQTMSNVIFYPMLRLASITDDTYEPYIPDNVDLDELKADKTQISNPNLLDNPWFTVNQRGFSSETGINKYTVDRWYTILSANLTVNANSSLTIEGTGDYGSCLCQILENALEEKLKGKIVTYSVLLSDGTIYSATDTFPTTYPSSADFAYCNLSSVIPNGFAVAVYWSVGRSGLVAQIGQTTGNSCTVVAMKLELGSVSTLAMDTVPNYGIELAKCKTSTADINDTYANKGKLLATNDLVSTVFTVSTSSWVADTTSQSGTTLYKKEISLSHVYVPCPEVAIGASGTTLPTKAQQTAYDLVQYATVDSSTNKLYLYASAVPSTQFYIKVTGVD